MASLFVPAARKPRFHVRCTLHELSNLPYVSGTAHARWRLLARLPERGQTPRVTVKDHQVVWNTDIDFEVTSIIGKDDGVLQPTELRISIKQETNGARAIEKLGVVIVDLAEFASQGRVTKRVLLQETKLNSVLKITIEMELIKGDAATFKVPQPKMRSGFESPLDVVHVDNADRKINGDANASGFGLEPNSILSRLSTVGAEHAQAIDQIFATAKETPA
ncbi:hypothetical protein HK105_202780 [Polyrhizophydium stewartii]|uniref:C2 NT-type domain-containing protein n=1 Tax=Polyrhizophydium stewartii TaxID=2732419 RepID=A0ABR4ND83_9FUNG